MKVVCKYTHNVFIFGNQYEAELIPNGSGDGTRRYKGDTRHFYTPEEWRELQLNKIFN